MAGLPLTQITPALLISQITDIYVRGNFQNLLQYFQTQNQLLNFNFFEQVFTKAQANVLVAHGLATAPQDIIVTRLTGTGNVTFNFGLFDAKNLNLTVTGPCRVRFFAGTYFNFQSQAASNSADAQTYTP